MKRHLVPMGPHTLQSYHSWASWGFGELRVMEEYIPGRLHLRPELWDFRKAQLRKDLEVFVACS